MNPKDAVAAKKPDLSLIPLAAAVYIAKALEEGARKYGPFNWRSNPVNIRVYIAAAKRHIDAFLDGENMDPENPEKPHLGGALASLAILADAIETGNAIDDRPPKGLGSKLYETRPSITRIPRDGNERHNVYEREMAKAHRAGKPAAISSEHDDVAKELDKRPQTEDHGFYIIREPIPRRHQ